MDTGMITHKRNLGIIGLGEVTERFHLPAIRESPFNLYSILGTNLKKTKAFAEKYKIPSYTTLEQPEKFFQDPSLDAVLIATPDNTHLSLAYQALTSGKHLLIEKPLGENYLDCKKFVEQVQKTDLIVQVGYHLRHHSGHQQLKKEIKKGTLGDIKKIKINWTYDFTQNPKWRTQAKYWALGTLGTHCLDLAQWLISDELPSVTNLSLTTTNTLYRGNEETSLLTCYLSNVEIIIYNSVIEKTPPTLEIYGSKDCAFGFNTLGPRGLGEVLIHSFPLYYQPINPYLAQLYAFEKNIEQKTKTNLEDALWNVEILNKAGENK